MDLLVLGSATGLAVPDRNASGYLLTHNDHAILVEAGDGISRQLARFQVDVNRIEAIFISHMHPDHAGGLITLIQQMYLKQRMRKLILFVPESVKENLSALFPMFNIIPERWPFDMDIRLLPGHARFDDWGLDFRSIPNGHLNKLKPWSAQYGMAFQAYSLSFRSGDGTQLLYTADTEDMGSLKSMMDAETTLLSECTHIDPEYVAMTAQAHRIKGIVFTHIPRGLEQKLRALQERSAVKIRIAEDGMEVAL